MPRMTLRRISTPVDDEIGSILDFAERASNFASQLGGDFRGTVSQRSVAIDQPSKLIGHSHAMLLRFASRVAHAVNQRHVRGVEKPRGGVDCFIE